MKEITTIVDFAQESESGLVVEIDENYHQDSDGNVPASFGPEEDVYFILIPPAAMTIISVATADDSDIQYLGEVERTRTEKQLVFKHPDDELELKYLAQGQPTATWYGRQSDLVLSDNVLTAEGAPCLGDVSYPVTGYSYCNRAPEGLSLGEDEQWFTGLVVEYRMD